MTYEAFVYCWTDKKTNKLYVGSHKGSIDDGYVCSSKYMMEEYKKRPEDFSRQIVAEGNYEECLLLETKILQSVNAKINENFYNMHNGDGKFYRKYITEESKKKISESHKGKLLSKEHKLSISKGLKNSEKFKNADKSNYGEKNGMFGKQHSQETKLKISKTKLGKKDSLETRLKKSESRKGSNNPNFGKASSERGKRWYYNPINNSCKRFTENTQPFNWVLGRPNVR